MFTNKYGENKIYACLQEQQQFGCDINIEGNMFEHLMKFRYFFSLLSCVWLHEVFPGLGGRAEIDGRVLKKNSTRI